MEVEKKTKDRILYPDILRTLTILAVLIIHVAATRWYSHFGTSEWFICNAYMASLRWCIPVFFMLSGIIILDPEYNLTFKKLYTKSIPRLVCALLFWAIMYRVLSPLTSIVLDLREVTTDDWKRIYTEILYGTPWHHLWFMYAIISLYILAPLIRVFTAYAEKKHYIYFLIIFFIFGSVVPHINQENNIHLNWGVYDLYSYTGYFIAGYFFSKYDLTKIQTRILYVVGVIALLWNVIASTLFAIKTGSGGTQFFNNISPTTVIISFFIFVLAKNVISNSHRIQKLQNNKLITLMASCSLGIYLVHDFFNIILKLLNINTGTFPAIISVPVLAIFVYLASFCLVLIIKKIPILNKWII